MKLESRASSGRSSELVRGARALAVVLPALVMLWGGYARRWIGDDGFINLRVVKQLLAGHGFVLNAGERVEAITSPLWALLLACAGIFGVRLESAAVALGLALSSAGVALVALALREAWRDDERWLLPGGALAYASLPAAWDYASAGLENGLGLSWLGLCALCVARATGRAHEPRARLSAGLLLGCAPLVRPDYVLLAAPLAGFLLCARRFDRTTVLTLVCLTLPGLSLQLFRMGYYAALVPNTALAKEAFEPRWQQGFMYLRNLVGTYRLGLPLAAVLGLQAASAWQTRRAPLADRPWFSWSLLVGGALHALYVVRLGGDFMHGRMLLPGAFAIFASVAIVPLPRERAARLVPWAGCLVLVLWSLVCAARFRVPSDNDEGIGDERGWHARVSHQAHPLYVEQYKRHFFHGEARQFRREIMRGCAEKGALAYESRIPCKRVLLLHPDDEPIAGEQRSFALRQDAAPAHVVAVVSMPPLGIASNVLGLRVSLVDPYGLADPVAARMQLGERGRPGHEKYFGPVWLAAKYAEPGVVSDPKVAIAAQVLACPPLRELAQATRDPLTMARFFANIPLAFRLHSLRVPEDPSEAKAILCK